MTRIAAVLAATIALGVAAPAAAQSSRKEAEKFFRAGEQAYNGGNYLLAAEAFEEAYAQLPLPAIAFSTAQAHRLQYVIDKDPRRLKRSVELYRKYIAEVKHGGRREDAVSHLGDLEPMLARIEARSVTPIGPIGRTGASQTRIMISTPNVKKGSRAAINGGKPEELPVVKPIAPGTYKIALSAPGYFPVQQEYTIVEGQFRAVEVSLTPRPAEVTLRAPADAEVVVDGRPVGTTPLLRPLELDAGKHMITVIQRGKEGWSREVWVSRGQKLALTAKLSRTKQRTLTYGVLGTAGAAFTLATIAGLSALGADGDASDLEDKRLTEGNITPAEEQRRRELIEDRDDALRVSYVMLGIGAGLAATGALLYYMDMPRPAAYEPPAGRGAEPARRSIVIAPTLSPDGGGLAVLGRF